MFWTCINLLNSENDNKSKKKNVTLNKHKVGGIIIVNVREFTRHYITMPVTDDNVRVTWSVLDGWYLYSEVAFSTDFGC